MEAMDHNVEQATKVQKFHFLIQFQQLHQAVAKEHHHHTKEQEQVYILLFNMVLQLLQLRKGKLEILSALNLKEHKELDHLL